MDYLCDFTFNDYEKDKFTYYKIDNRINEQELRGSILSQLSQNTAESVPEVEFRGYALSKLLESDSKVNCTDIFYHRSICLIVRNEENQPFKLKPLNLDLQTDPEICEYCDERSALTIACSCKEAFYCSIKCRIKNMNFHKRTCPLSLDIEPLYETLPPFELQDTINYDMGLLNMGNSCYLSAVLQVLRFYPDLYHQMKSLNHQEMVEINRKGLNIFPYMEDAFKRMNFSGCKEYAPYLLKAAIGIKNNSVGGNMT